MEMQNWMEQGVPFETIVDHCETIGDVKNLCDNVENESQM